MKRLEDKATSSVESLIKKLELLIVQDKTTDENISIIQKTLDKIDEEQEEPNFRHFELQSIIYYVKNDKTKCLEFIEDALSLNPYANEYSKIGGLLAEIYISGKQGNIKQSEDNRIEEEIEYDEEDEDLPEIDVVKSLKSLDRVKKKQYEDVYKTIKDTSFGVQAVGYIGFYISALVMLGSDFTEDSKITIAFLSLIIIALSLFYIYLGKYISSFYRKRLQLALFGILLMSLVASFGILSLIVAIYAIISLVKIRKIKNDDFFIENTKTNGFVYYSRASNIAITLGAAGWIFVILRILES